MNFCSCHFLIVYLKTVVKIPYDFIVVDDDELIVDFIVVDDGELIVD